MSLCAEIKFQESPSPPASLFFLFALKEIRDFAFTNLQKRETDERSEGRPQIEEPKKRGEYRWREEEVQCMDESCRGEEDNIECHEDIYGAKWQDMFW